MTTSRTTSSSAAHRFTVVCVLLLAVSCDPIDPPGQTPFSDQDVASSADQMWSDGLDVQAVPMPTIDGIWLHYHHVATCVDLGSLTETFVRGLHIIESVQNTSGILSETWTACDIELSPVLGMTPAVTDGLLITTFPIVTEGGLVTGTIAGGGYSSGPVAELWGVALDDPVNDSFPTDIDDPRIFDSDLDGKPAATLVFGDFCETYVAQRTSSAFYGEYTAPDRIEGTAVSTTEQIVIDATQSLCEISYETRSNDARNTFVRIRIDGQGNSLNLDANGDGQITCDEVIPYKDILFERIECDAEYCYSD